MNYLLLHDKSPLTFSGLILRLCFWQKWEGGDGAGRGSRDSAVCGGDRVGGAVAWCPMMELQAGDHGLLWLEEA